MQSVKTYVAIACPSAKNQCSSFGIDGCILTSLLCAILAGRDSQWRAYDVGSQLPDIRCYPSVQKGKADFALIAKGPLGLRGPKITLVIWSKSADKHLTLCTHRGSNWGSLEEGLPRCRMPETPRRSGMQPVDRSRRIVCEFSVYKRLFRVRESDPEELSARARCSACGETLPAFVCSSCEVR